MSPCSSLPLSAVHFSQLCLGGFRFLGGASFACVLCEIVLVRTLNWMVSGHSTVWVSSRRVTATGVIKFHNFVRL